MSDSAARLQSLETEQYRQAAIIAAWQKDVSWLQLEVANHSKALTDGNNGHSVVTRLALVEQRVAEQTAAVNALRERLEAREAEGRRGRWDLTKTLLSALLAVASGLLLAILLK